MPRCAAIGRAGPPRVQSAARDRRNLVVVSEQPADSVPVVSSSVSFVSYTRGLNLILRARSPLPPCHVRECRPPLSPSPTLSPSSSSSSADRYKKVRRRALSFLGAFRKRGAAVVRARVSTCQRVNVIAVKRRRLFDESVGRVSSKRVSPFCRQVSFRVFSLCAPAPR